MEKRKAMRMTLQAIIGWHDMRKRCAYPSERPASAESVEEMAPHELDASVSLTANHIQPCWGADMAINLFSIKGLPSCLAIVLC